MNVLAAVPVQEEPMLFDYRGARYPSYLCEGNAAQHIVATAKHFCKGIGLDIGCGRWVMPGATPIDKSLGDDAAALPGGYWDYIFSSHLLEHLEDPIAVLAHWKTRLKLNGVLFLYLPHPDMVYWRPQHCRKHRHIWQPVQMAEILTDLGFVDVIHSERDLAWSFAVVGWNP